MDNVQIHLVTKDTDLSTIIPYDWDVMINNRPYYVCRIDHCIHCVGGKLAINNLWAYPRNEQPSYENLIQYNCDDAVDWGIEYKEIKYTKYKWDEKSAEISKGATITRNGKPFYTVYGNINYAIDKARCLIAEICEHPMNLNTIDFDKKVIGRKVWFKSQPMIVTQYCTGGCVMLRPEEKFIIPAEDDNDNDRDVLWGNYLEDGQIKEDIFSKTINWFRK